jgi:hypothetical protein
MSTLAAHATRYAPFGHCPVFNCGAPLPGKHAVLCADHFFCVPADRARAAIRMKIKAMNGAGPAHEDQAKKHVKALVALIEGRSKGASSARPEGELRHA